MRRSLFAAVAAVAALSACQPRPGAPPEPPAAPAEAPMQTPAPAETPQTSLPEGPDMAPERVPVSETPCREAIGEAAAARLVQRCIQVSPATHPPCNAANPCDLIQGEIDRSCRLWKGDGDVPAECAA